MSEPRSFLDGRVVLWAGDCKTVLKELADNSIDSVVTDPPYHLQSIVKRFGKAGSAPVRIDDIDASNDLKAAYARQAAGFMGKHWDGGDIAFQPELWAEVLRVLKPGGYIMAFSGCRTYHRMACAIEDAGFITHPFFAWCFGSGFPKAHSVSKQLDRMAGIERKIVGRGASGRTSLMGGLSDTVGEYGHDITIPATDAAREWDGWFYGTQSLKPALEPIYFGQKPFEKGLNGAQNVLKWGVGAIFVDGTRVRHRTMDTILSRAKRTFLCAALECGNSIFCKDSSPDADMFSRTLGKQLSAALDLLISAPHEDDRVQISSSLPDCQDGCSIYSHLCDALFHIAKDDVLSSVQQQQCAHKHIHPSMTYGDEDRELICNALYVCVNHLSNLGSLLRSDPQADVLFLAEELWHAFEEYLKLFLECIGTDLPTRLSSDHLHKIAQSLVLSPLKTILEGCNSDVDSACENILINVLLSPYIITNSENLLIKSVEKTGRWPANLIHDNSEEVLACFPETGVSNGGSGPASKDWKGYGHTVGANLAGATGGLGDSGSAARFFKSFPQENHLKRHPNTSTVYGADAGGQPKVVHSDSGSQARFFASFPQDKEQNAKRIWYGSKADHDDRLGSSHPTVKPLALIQYLTRLITPKNGTCLDLFAGTGVTGEACFREGFRSILIEREAEYIADIERRMSLVMAGPDTRAHASMKARNRPHDDGPLFANKPEAAE